MREEEKNGDNGSADLLTVDILASRVQSALGRVQAATEALRRLRAEAKKLARRSRPVASARLSPLVADAETCFETLQEAESDLYAADYLATRLLPNMPHPVDEGDRRLRRAILIAAGGDPGFPCWSPPTPRQNRRRPRRASRSGSPDGAAA